MCAKLKGGACEIQQMHKGFVIFIVLVATALFVVAYLKGGEHGGFSVTVGAMMLLGIIIDAIRSIRRMKRFTNKETP